MSGIKMGQFIYGNSFIHSLDPRTKILCCLFIIISVLINPSWYNLLIYTLLMFFAIFSANLNFKYIGKSLSRLKYFFLFTFIFQAFLTPGETLFLIGKFSITKEGLILGGTNVLRMIILFLGSMIVLMTTSPLKLTAGLEFLLQPLSKLRIPVYNLTTVLSISFRFLPTLFEEVSIIRDAQKSRGAPFDAPRLRTRLQAYGAILIPLFESSLTRAKNLGEAMDSRCFTVRPNKLRLSSIKMTGQDFIVLSLKLMLLSTSLISK